MLSFYFFNFFFVCREKAAHARELVRLKLLCEAAEGQVEGIMRDLDEKEARP